MGAPNVVVTVEAASNTVNNGDDSNKPGGKCAEIESTFVPVWAALMAIVQRGNVYVAFADYEVIGALKQY